MKVLSLISQKGGVGRSSLSAHLAVAFEEIGLFTVVIDLDNQGSAQRWSDSREADAPTVVSGVASRLQSMLETTRKAGVKLVIVDTPPYSSELSLSAASVADIVAVPLRAAIFDLRSIGDTAELLKLSGKMAQTVAILNWVRHFGTRADEGERYAAALGMDVAPARIFDRVAFADALVSGMGITEFEPNGKAAEEMRALRDYLMQRLGLKKRGQS